MSSRTSPTHAHRKLTAILTIMLAGCAPDAPQSDQVAGLPKLVQVNVPYVDSLMPENRYASIAVSRSGSVAFTTGFDPENSNVTVVDTLGQVVARFGRRGTGPGEWRPSLVTMGAWHSFAFVGPSDDILVLDAAQRRFHLFNSDGEYKHTSTSTGFIPGIPIRFAADSVDMFLVDFERPRRITEVRRVDVASLGHRVIFAPADTAYNAAAQLTFVSGKDVVVVGNPYAYQLQSHDTRGAPLVSWGLEIPPRFRSSEQIDSALAGVVDAAQRRQREERLRDARPHFGYTAFDSTGLLWVFGFESSGEQFVDVFQNTTYLGRTTLSCNLAGAPVLRGEWMAVMCLDPSKDSGATVQLYRIVW